MKAYSKRTFRDGNMESTLWEYEFTDSNDREKMLEKLHIGSQFDMRYRALFLFYGDDLVAYKKKIGSNKNGTEFLRILAKHFTSNLEDDAPSSWEECQSSFWEDLIFACFPHLMKLSKDQKQSIIFLSQLQKFVRWLDKTKGTSCYQFIEKYFDDAALELPHNEKILNQLLLLEYPTIYEQDWDIEKELKAGVSSLNAASLTHSSIFQILNIHDNIVHVKDIDTKADYQICDIPYNHLMNRDMLLDGVIGRNEEDIFWNWLVTGGIYSKRAKKYIKFID